MDCEVGSHGFDDADVSVIKSGSNLSVKSPSQASSDSASSSQQSSKGSSVSYKATLN